MKELSQCKGKCGESLPLTEDYFYFNRTQDRFFGKCISCYSEERRNYLYKQKYNISSEEVEDMFIKQKGKCKISGVSEDELDVMLNVDHCHDTGYVRGLLTGPINRGLGLFNHSVTLLLSGALYILISKVKIKWKLLNGTLKSKKTSK